MCSQKEWPRHRAPWPGWFTGTGTRRPQRVTGGGEVRAPGCTMAGAQRLGTQSPRMRGGAQVQATSSGSELGAGLHTLEPRP